MKIFHWKRDARAIEKKSQRTKNCFSSSWLCLSKFCHANVDSRARQTILLKKVEKLRPKFKLRFSCFSGENFGTILSRRARLSRTSRAPSPLIRPRSSDCDGGPKQTMKNFPVVGHAFFEHLTSYQKKVFSRGPPSSPDLHPKRSP